MSEPSPHLPPGIDKLTGAEVGFDWTLCWNDADAAVYSRDSGWIGVGGLKGPVSLAHPTPNGILLLSAETGTAGFWRYGERAWSWWESIPQLQDASYVHCAGDTLVLFRIDYPINQFQIFSVAGKLTEIGEVLGDEYGPLIGATIDRSGWLVLTCGQGLHRVQMEADTLSFVPVVSKEIKTDTLSPYNAVAVSAPDALYFAQLLSNCIRIDTETGEVTDTGLGHIPGCNSLWRALADGRCHDIPFLLEILKFVPRTDHIFSDEVLALSFDGHTTGTVATPAGIIELDVAVPCCSCGQLVPVTSVSCSRCGNSMPDGSGPDPLPESAATHYQAQVVSWNLALDPARNMQAAIDQLLESVGYSTEVLARSIAKNIGFVACQELVERARQLDLDHIYYHSLDGVQRLFGCFGPEASDLVRKCLADRNPGVLAFGCTAAAACDANGPLVWDLDHPIPSVELVSLLVHENSFIRTVAGKACGALEIEESQQPLTDLLSDSNWNIRLTAVESLTSLPSIDPTTQQAIIDLATGDTEDSVREAAVKALGKHGEDPASLETLIRALGDLDYNPRSSACEIVAERSADLSATQFLRIVDTAALVMMTANLADDPSDFTTGMDELLVQILDHLVLPNLNIQGLEQLAPELQEIICRCSMLGLHPIPKADEITLDDEDEAEEYRQVLDRLESGVRLEDRDLERLLESPGSPPSFDLASRMSRTDPELGARLAIVAIFANRENFHHHDSNGSVLSEYDPGGYRPLHLRLRTESVTPNPQELCRAIVESQAQQKGVAGLAGLFCLAAAGDSFATDRLIQRVLERGSDGCEVVLSSLLFLVDRWRRPELMQQILAAHVVPLKTRMELYDDWSLFHDLELSASERRPILTEMMGSTDVPESTRLEAARDLADAGEAEVLEEYWKDTDPETLSADRLYEYSKDMARAGHPEHLRHVRGTWIERGDLEALKAFIAVGTHEDLEELEHALELKAPEKMIRDAMDAIRSRTADD